MKKNFGLLGLLFFLLLSTYILVERSEQSKHSVEQEVGFVVPRSFLKEIKLASI